MFKSGHFETRSARFNLACCIHRMESIKCYHITSSFENKGVFPQNPSIAERFWSIHIDEKGRIAKDIRNNLGSMSSVHVSDHQTVKDIQTILSNRTEDSIKLCDINALFQRRENASSISSSHRTKYVSS